MVSQLPIVPVLLHKFPAPLVFTGAEYDLADGQNPVHGTVPKPRLPLQLRSGDIPLFPRVSESSSFGWAAVDDVGRDRAVRSVPRDCCLLFNFVGSGRGSSGVGRFRPGRRPLSSWTGTQPSATVGFDWVDTH